MNETTTAKRTAGPATAWPWEMIVDEGACFHPNNRVSIIDHCRVEHDHDNEDGECELQTIAEFWPGDNGVDVQDAQYMLDCIGAIQSIGGDPATVAALVEALREALRGMDGGGDNSPCHHGLTTRANCCQCKRVDTVRAALDRVRGTVTA